MTNLAAITLESPKGGAWEFLVLFLVVILGPPIVQRLRIPGIIGLLIGGFLIGPNGLGLLDAGSTTIPDLGQLGLLYLMFVAGVELDLALLRQYRRSAITFGLLTFSFPMLFGTVAAFAIGWDHGGGAAARVAARVAHARALSADPRREAGERPDGGEHRRRDGADRHDRAGDPRRRRRDAVGVGQRRRDRAADRARADRARAVLLRAAADRRPAPVPAARDGAHASAT